MSHQEQSLNELLNKLFVMPAKKGTQEEPATVGDYLNIAYALGKLSHAAEVLERVALDNAPLLTVGDLRRIMGNRERKAISSVEELERLLRLG